MYEHEIKLIRKALKRLAPTLSVRRDRGTASNWIDVSGSGEFGEFNQKEKEALEKFGLNYGVNSALISPENRRFYTERAAKILGVFLPKELEREYQEEDRYKEELKKKDEERRKRFESCDHEFVKVPVVMFPSGTLYKCKKCGFEKIVLD